MVKKAFKMSLKLKGCDTVFYKKFGPGIIAEATYTFTFADDTKMDVFVSRALMDYERKLIDDHVRVIIDDA